MEASKWRFHQVFGEKGNYDDITEADIISAVEFDHTGEVLATGDRGGRIVLFERDNSTKGSYFPAEYVFYTEFQSHEPEFDYLKSLEIEERINQIQWLKRQNRHRMLLSTNDKTIKLWKIYEKAMHTVTNLNNRTEEGSPLPAKIIRDAKEIRVPQLHYEDTIYAATPRRYYANAHAYHINSISINADDELFLSADDLRINLWHLSNTKESFQIVDMKPANMEELTEVITSAQFHPTECHTFVYSTSKGAIKVADMRMQSLCDSHAKIFEQEEDPANKSFFSEIISSVSSVRYNPQGTQLISRDYLTVKLWDVRNEKAPVHTFTVHEYLRSKLCDLYENDCIFDKFEAEFSGDGKRIMTGSYHNLFHVMDIDGSNDVWPLCSWRTPAITVCLDADANAVKNQFLAPLDLGKNKAKPQFDVDQIDFNRKVLHSSWSPTENVIAVAATNNLCLFSLDESQA